MGSEYIKLAPTCDTDIFSSDFVINYTKCQYINLMSSNSDKVRYSLVRFLITTKIWGKDDHIESMQFEMRHEFKDLIDIGIVLKFYDAACDGDKQSVVVPAFIGMTMKSFIEIVKLKIHNKNFAELDSILSENETLLKNIDADSIINLLKECDDDGRLVVHILDKLDTAIIDKFTQEQIIEFFSQWGFHHRALRMLEPYFLSGKISPNIQNSDGDTPLHVACESGFMDIVMGLESLSSTDYNITNNKSMPPIYLAVLRGHNDIVKFLISSGKVDPYKEYLPHYNLLCYACKKGKLEITKYLVEEVKMQINIPNSVTGGTPFHAAAANNLDCLKYLISKESQHLYVKNKHGYTILHTCTSNNDIDCFKYLIEEVKFDPTTLGPDNCNALQLAVINKCNDVIKYIMDNSLIDPYSITKSQMIFDYSNSDVLKQFYENHHTNSIIIKKDTKISLNDKMSFVFVDNYSVSIHNNILFLFNDSIIKSDSHDPGARTNNYFRIRNKTKILLNDCLETTIDINSNAQLMPGVCVTLPKGKKVFINDILVTLETNLDVKVII